MTPTFASQFGTRRDDFGTVLSHDDDAVENLLTARRFAVEGRRWFSPASDSCRKAPNKRRRPTR
jgi:hypothetical protein